MRAINKIRTQDGVATPLTSIEDFGAHSGGYDDGVLLWAKVIEGTALNKTTSTSDFTATVLVTKHTTNFTDATCGRVGLFSIDFRASGNTFNAKARWLLKSKSLGTPSIKIGVEVVSERFVVRVYVQNKGWTNYSFKIVSCAGWSIVGFNWECFKGRTDTATISTYATLPASANETVIDFLPYEEYATMDDLPGVFIGSDDAGSGSTGLVPAPGMSRKPMFLSSEKNNPWISPDTSPTQDSDNVITSGAVYAAIGDIETLLAGI